MVKKILPTLVLGIFAIGLVAPTIVSAQPRVANECCKIRHTFKAFSDTTFTKGCVIGKQNGFCVIGGETKGLVSLLDEGATCGATQDIGFKSWGMACMLNTIYTATNWLFYILMLIVVIMIVVGGFTYMTAYGDPEKAGKGKNIIVYALIGLAVALFAKVIPSIVKFMMGVG